MAKKGNDAAFGLVTLLALMAVLGTMAARVVRSGGHMPKETVTEKTKHSTVKKYFSSHTLDPISPQSQLKNRGGR